VLEVRAVEDAGREDHDRRVAGTIRGRGAQRGEQHPWVVVDRADSQRGERLGEDVGHRAPVGHDVADPGRDADVVLEDPEDPGLVTDQIDAGDVGSDVVGRTDAVDRPVEVWRAGDELPGDDSLLDRARHVLGVVVDVGEERLQRADALFNALLDDGPLVGRDHPGHRVQWEGPLFAGVIEGDALVKVAAGEVLSALAQRLGFHRAERVVDGAVGTPGLIGAAEHLVPGVPESVVLEEVGHGPIVGRSVFPACCAVIPVCGCPVEMHGRCRGRPGFLYTGPVHLPIRQPSTRCEAATTAGGALPGPGLTRVLDRSTAVCLILAWRARTLRRLSHPLVECRQRPLPRVAHGWELRSSFLKGCPHELERWW
jgi:hypothetical protein